MRKELKEKSKLLEEKLKLLRTKEVEFRRVTLSKDKAAKEVRKRKRKRKCWFWKLLTACPLISFFYPFFFPFNSSSFYSLSLLLFYLLLYTSCSFNSSYSPIFNTFHLVILSSLLFDYFTFIPSFAPHDFFRSKNLYFVIHRLFH